jgi:hypothetical protein
MPEMFEAWDPNEWELHVLGLLQDRHGPLNVNKVPARHQGDLGLDYYSLGDRVVYQCYAVQEPCEVADRAEKQKTKMTIDLKKFCTRKDQLKAIFGTREMTRWVLTVPLHDSVQLNAHTTRKTAEVKALELPYVSADFEVMIQDLDSFVPASRAARALQRSVLSVPSRTPSPQEIDDWSDSSDALVDTLTNKLRKRIVGGAQDELDESVRLAVGWFLERENALESLRGTAPDFHEALVDVISQRLERLKFYGPPASGPANQILRDELQELAAEMQARVPNFSSSSANKMALGTLAEWLMRCPLDFPPYGHAS